MHIVKTLLVRLKPGANRFCHLCRARQSPGRNVYSFQIIRHITLARAIQLLTRKVDPRVVALKDMLLYCDYLYYDRKIEPKMRKQALEIIAKQKELTGEKGEDPVYSVVVEDTDDEECSSSEGDDTDSEEDVEDAEVPIHMPYAHVDQYQALETDAAVKEQNVEEDNGDTTASLNQQQKALYEMYLQAKITASKNGQQLTFEEYLNSTIPRTHLHQSLSNVPANWMTDFEQFDDSKLETSLYVSFGTPDLYSKVSSIPCGGCGALLHCKDVALPGYLPSELFLGKSKKELKSTTCQRCHFLKYYNTALEVKVSAEDYPNILKPIKQKKCAVILMVDLTDFPCSIWPDVKSLLHPMTPVFVVGNKVDLLPPDSPKFLDRVKQCLVKAVVDRGIQESRIKHVALISAKTGYGVEELINKLYSLWGYKGDVYMIGCTNVGKSSLFNTFLKSDYCKVQAADLVHRATISPWPGTTINLLKFPILNPIKRKMYLRTKRLISERKMKIDKQHFNKEQLFLTRNIKYATLQGDIGRTFVPEPEMKKDPFSETSYRAYIGGLGIDENHPDFKLGRWCYDTPGAVQPDQIVDLLTTEELLLTLPRYIISPRTFILHPEQTAFVGGLGRLDYIEGGDFIRCTLFASKALPLTICYTTHANYLYKALLLSEAFAVPKNDPKRLKLWPELASKDMKVMGIDQNESAADVVMSNAGWIAITPLIDQEVLLRAWTPEGRGLHLRVPALLSKSVTLRGTHMKHTPVYSRGLQVWRKV